MTLRRVHQAPDQRIQSQITAVPQPRPVFDLNLSSFSGFSDFYQLVLSPLTQLGDPDVDLLPRHPGNPNQQWGIA
ncbi:uncharacterized protein CcaverHIS019_0100660 [Cutaneotrichosporon cavernicola]|uniref:Uncharacterized protein n=1 Tax=Cutaneotrichosporon cavernicola TaxID=279322 RepID=A0AA48IHP9_9TREE|nr:uncharacterized protein CcaverHIS019_0100660 [Cutaneotrichosporon cavernicola]BEI87348.1 hypothetical protein CcaverHIS019_0100660 [Cutaneotrichosporon cavernicola]